MAGIYFKKGVYNMVCDRCGLVFKSDKLRRDGYNPALYVCKEDYDPPHPQDRLRAVRDKQSVPVARPEPSDRFVSLTEFDGDHL